MIYRFLLAISSFVIIFLLQIKQGTAIQCYVCNSKIHKNCGDPFDKTSIALVDCDSRIRLKKKMDEDRLPKNLEEEEELTKVNNDTSTLCRKIVQKVDDDVRYIRECGYVKLAHEEGRNCINRAGTYHVSMKYCKCENGDGCNSVGRLVPSIVVALISSFFILKNYV